MHIDSTFPPPDCRLAQVMRVLSDLTGPDLATVIDTGIALLDKRGGDPDLEDTDDAERFADDDGGSFPEWHTLSLSDQRAGRVHGRKIGSGELHEDDEDGDDDSCQAGDDGFHAIREWGTGRIIYGVSDADGDSADASWPEGDHQPDTMRAYDDDEREDDAKEARVRFVRRVQRTRCVERRWNPGAGFAYSTYRLKSDKPVVGWVRQ